MCIPHFDESSSSLMDNHRGRGYLNDILRPTNPPSSSDDHEGVKDCARDDCLPHGDAGDCDHGFGDPFSNTKDPLLHELDPMTPAGFSFFAGSISEDSAIYPVEEKGHETFPCEIAFNCGPYVPPVTSKSPQQDLSTSAMPFGSLENTMACSEMINLNSGVRMIDTATAMQISAVQKSSMKRRKGPAKKVVYIPATTMAANGRSGGEVVPSDLWAWRKGYYRCSSSKGCLARKQVERSLGDPNMLVITYTSEHNHPWPTQRNALAGSTRGTHSGNKSNNRNKAAPKVSSSSLPNKDRQPLDKRPSDVVSPREDADGGSSSAHIKEEMEVTNSETLEEAGMMGSVRGKSDEDDDFMFREMETMDSGCNPLSFLLNPGEKLQSCPADSDSFDNFFDWSD